jgi:hypothetical protein
LKVLAALLFSLGGVCVAVAAIVLSNIFDEYKDSPDSTYVEFAAVPGLLGLLFLVAGALARRRS